MNPVFHISEDGSEIEVALPYQRFACFEPEHLERSHRPF